MEKLANVIIKIVIRYDVVSTIFEYVENVLSLFLLYFFSASSFPVQLFFVLSSSNKAFVALVKTKQSHLFLSHCFPRRYAITENKSIKYGNKQGYFF